MPLREVFTTLAEHDLRGSSTVGGGAEVMLCVLSRLDGFAPE